MFIEHVNLSVADIEKSIDFYCRLFDFRLRWRCEPEAERQEAHVGNETIYLALFQAVEGSEAPKSYKLTGLNHFGIVVDDLEIYRARLKDLGVTPHFEPEYPPDRRFYFYDPDQIEVELVQYAQSHHP